MRHLSFVLLVGPLFGPLVGCAETEPERPTAPEEARSAVASAPRYELTRVDATLGGTVAVGAAIANDGVIAGYSTRADGTRHAVLLRDELIDLETLGGPNSAVLWPGLNEHGMVVGVSQTADPDPNRARWSCEAFMPDTDRTCVGFVWEDGVMTPLPTLGGYNGFAAGVNDLGQVVGWAETGEEDPTCHRPEAVLGFHAVMWDPRSGTMQELPPLPGDVASAATAINNRGLVIGISGICHVAVGDSSARASVLWRNGVPAEIPNLGGDTWNTPMDINEAGHVVGFSNLGNDASGAPRLFGFLWTGGPTATHLGALDEDDTLVQAYGINARGQVVGRSCGDTGCRAFLYQDGTMYDLNELAGAGDDNLFLARHINDAGAITGQMVEAGTDRTLIFVATPKDSD